MSVQQNGVDERRRVKVYELRVNDWFDRGTGFCMPQAIHDEAKIHVEAEDDPNRDLLELMIKKEDAFQKQQETLIVWTDQNGVDMALSFQEAEGCGLVWSLIGHVQQRLSDGNDSILQLPAAQLDNLDAIEDVMRRGITTQQARETILKLIFADTQNVYISKLTALVGVAEDLESLPDLHRLCNIMKTLILFNDSSIIEFVVRDDQILGFVGALEYDPDFPHHKANHRQFLSDASKFREVVPMPDPQITQKIHYTYRLQYLKDVVLARILDDPTFNVLNSLIFFNQVDIVQHIQADNEYLSQLVQTISSPSSDPRKRRDGVLFIQQSCAIAKGLQVATRTSLFRNLIECGLFNVISSALQHSSATVRVAGTDILVALIDHDALMVRSHIISAVGDKMKPMTETLIELLHVETDLGVKAQIADAMKVLLDCTSQGPQQERMGEPPNTFLAKFRVNSTFNTTDAFLDHFYNDPRSAKALFGPLRDLKTRPSLEGLSIQEVSLYSHLIEILSFIVRQPKFSRAFILEEGLVARVAQLMKSPDKHLKLSAIKYLRVCLSLNDPDGFHRRQMIQYNLFEPVIDMVEEMMPRDNLLSSAGLEMFEFIRRENIRHVVFHLVENYRHRLDSIKSVDTFRGIVLRYEEFLNPPPPSQSQPDGADSSFMTSDAETPNTRHVILNGGDPRWQAQLRENLDEDSYFDSDDVEDELAESRSATVRGANGLGPSPRPLVNYDDDDDEDDEDEADDDDDDDNDRHDEGHEEEDDDRASADGDQTPASQEDKSTGTDSSGTVEDNAAHGHVGASPATDDKQSSRPPSSISEKRRREEDDEDDELRKISQGAKRRNSGIGKASTSQNGNVAQLSYETGTEQLENPSAESRTDIPAEPSTHAQKNNDKAYTRVHGLRRGRSGNKLAPDKHGKIAISLGAKESSKESNEAKG